MLRHWRSFSFAWCSHVVTRGLKAGPLARERESHLRASKSLSFYGLRCSSFSLWGTRGVGFLYHGRTVTCPLGTGSGS